MFVFLVHMDFATQTKVVVRAVGSNLKVGRPGAPSEFKKILSHFTVIV